MPSTNEKPLRVVYFSSCMMCRRFFFFFAIRVPQVSFRMSLYMAQMGSGSKFWLIQSLSLNLWYYTNRKIHPYVLAANTRRGCIP